MNVIKKPPFEQVSKKSSYALLPTMVSIDIIQRITKPNTKVGLV